jgi:hypothetical protein
MVRWRIERFLLHQNAKATAVDFDQLLEMVAVGFPK